MESLRNFYDRFALKFELNGAILYLLLFVLLCGLGVLQTRHWARVHDETDLVLGFCSQFIGIVGIFHAAQVIRAVVRRERSQSKDAL